ncbi:hypothetical protein SANTM175S_04777 [Streptomyces antimycoticus]
MSLQNKVAVVTGAAGGLGAAVADHLGSAGARVIRADRSFSDDDWPDRVALDVADAASWDRFAARVREQAGRLDILVNNAGISMRTDVVGTADEDFARAMRVNVWGLWRGIKTFADDLTATGGCVVNVGSIYRSHHRPGLDTYRARFRDQAGLEDADIDRWGRRYYEVALAYDPDIAAMLEGMAAGSGRREPPSVRSTRVPNSSTAPDTATRAAPRSPVLPGHTADGHTLLAQNWDWHPETGGRHLPARHPRPQRGSPCCRCTEAGMLAKSGLNSAGLTSANLLVSDPRHRW